MNKLGIPLICILMFSSSVGCDEKYYSSDKKEYKEWIKKTGLNPLMPRYYWMQRIIEKCPVCKKANTRESKPFYYEWNVKDNFKSIKEADTNPPPQIISYEIICDKCGVHFTVKNPETSDWLEFNRVYRAYGYEGN